MGIAYQIKCRHCGAEFQYSQDQSLGMMPRWVRELCGDRGPNPLPRLQPPTQHLAGGFPGAGADRHIVGLTPQMKPQRGGGSKKIAKKVRELKKNS